MITRCVPVSEPVLAVRFNGFNMDEVEYVTKSRRVYRDPYGSAVVTKADGSTVLVKRCDWIIGGDEFKIVSGPEFQDKYAEVKA